MNIKIKRAAVALSVLSVLLAGVMLFSACGKKPKPVAVDLSQYTIVRSQNGSTDSINAARSLRSVFKTLGVDMEVQDDWSRDGSYDPSAKEILIGQTNREESKALLGQIEGEGYAICFTGHKVVINATRDVFLNDAVAYFAESVLGGSLAPEVVPEIPMFSEPYSLLTLAADGKTDYKIVREANSADRITELALGLREAVKSQTGVALDVEMDRYSDESDANACEILLGHTNRPESASALEGVPADGYIISISNNKIILNAWSLKGIEQAVERFRNLLKNGYANGVLAIPATSGEQGKIGQTLPGVPVPENLRLCSAYKGLGDTLESVYGGASEAAFEAYRALLERAGYKEYQKHRIGENRFAVYTLNNTALYVSYFPWDRTLRVVSESYSHMPATGYTASAQVTAGSLTQLSLNDAAGNFGMGYIFTLEDGSYFIIDGGGKSGEDEEVLFRYLQEHNCRTDGKIVIAAWLFTHEHWDHVTNFLDFTGKYASQVTLEEIYWNFAQSGEFSEIGAHYDDMINAFAKYAGVRIIKVHAGQSIWVRNANIEILYTHETLNPYFVADMNDTSTVFRVNIAGRKILFLADVSTITQKNCAVKVIYGLYGKELKSDILQVAHHGWNGGSVEIYSVVLPEIALWPVEASRWETVSQYTTSRKLLEMYTGGVIRELYVAKDGEVTIVFD